MSPTWTRWAKRCLASTSFCASLTAGCVQRATYEGALADLREAREQSSVLSHEAEALRVDARRAEQATEKHRAESAALKSQTAELNHKVEDLMVLNAELTERLKGAGQNVEQLASERGNLRQALADTRTELAEWRKQQQVISARTAQQRQLAAALQPLVETKGVEVGTRNGRVMVVIPSDQLFDPGSSAVKPAGRPILTQLAGALKSLQGRSFRIATHTDVAKPAPVSPNWQLSASRSLTLTRELIGAGVPVERLSAAAHAEYDPIAPNDVEANRVKNRWIEIVLVPLPEELVKPGPVQRPAAR